MNVVTPLRRSSPWLLAKEAAEYLGMHADTVRDLMRRGDLQAVKVGKNWRTKRDWCDTYLMEA